MSHGFERVLPDRILKMVDRRDRHLLGKQETYDEVMAEAKVKVERDLHDMIEGLLRRLGIVYVHSRMDRKTTIRAGLPDFMFVAAAPNYPLWTVAMEVKLPGEGLDDEQELVRKAMTSRPNAWQYFVVRSYDEAREVLRSCGFK
jgi:hypothetical protein